MYYLDSTFWAGWADHPLQLDLDLVQDRKPSGTKFSTKFSTSHLMSYIPRYSSTEDSIDQGYETAVESRSIRYSSTLVPCLHVVPLQLY